MLQLPAQPTCAAEADAQKRVPHVGCQSGTGPIYVGCLAGGLLFHARDVEIAAEGLATK